MIGTKLGNWVIDKELGRGGMGQVYLAHEDGAAASEGRQVAVKVLAPELAQELGFVERFQREIDTLKQLSHPHIVRFFDSGYQEGRYFYAMEYVQGSNFEDVIRERGRLPWREVLDIALQISPALKHAQTVDLLVAATGRDVKVLHVVGGGARNELLCEWTAHASGLPVLAGPDEATLYGNLLVQAIALGELSSLAEARDIVRRSYRQTAYEPDGSEAWREARERFDLLTAASDELEVSA